MLKESVDENGDECACVVSCFRCLHLFERGDAELIACRKLPEMPERLSALLLGHVLTQAGLYDAENI
jgi:hypothetical protein